MSDGNRVYLGNLPVDVSKSEIQSAFKSYNPTEVTLKDRFGFIEFSEAIDADDAIHDMNGTKVSGSRIVVERARAARKREKRDDRGFRVVIKNLPPKTTWQDVKDFMRKAGRVVFADVLKDSDGEGVVEFSNLDDMKYALKELDDRKLNGQRVRLEESNSRRDRSSRSCRRSRSPRRSSKSRCSRSIRNSRSPRRSRSSRRSPARSVSPRRSISPKDSRSRSSRKNCRYEASVSRSRSSGRERNKSFSELKIYDDEKQPLNEEPVPVHRDLPSQDDVEEREEEL